MSPGFETGLYQVATDGVYTREQVECELLEVRGG